MPINSSHSVIVFFIAPAFSANHFFLCSGKAERVFLNLLNELGLLRASESSSRGLSYTALYYCTTLMNLVQAFPEPLLRRLHIKVGLKVHPELWRLAKIFTEPKCNITGYRPRTVNNITDSHGRYSNVMCKTGLRNTHLPYNLSKYYTWMHRLKVSSHDIPPFLVIVCNLNIMRTICIKPEADTPLVIDSDAPLTGPLTRKRLKTIRRRQPQIFDCYGSIKLSKFNNSPFLNVLWQLARLYPLKQPLSFFTGKRPYHKYSINKLFTRCQVTGGVK